MVTLEDAWVQKSKAQRAAKYSRVAPVSDTKTVPIPAKRGFDSGGSRNHPIDLLSDEESTVVSKRQKTTTDSAANIRRQANVSRMRATAATFQPLSNISQQALPEVEANIAGSHDNKENVPPVDRLHAAAANAARNLSGGAFTQQENFVSLMDLDPNPRDRPITIAPLDPQPLRRRIIVPPSRNGVPVELEIVRNKLDNAAEEVQNCRLIMRKAFNQHVGKLDQDEVIEHLKALSEHFEGAEEECRQAVQEVDRVKDLVVKMG